MGILLLRPSGTGTLLSWWLLLARPDDWEESPSDFITQYMPRHKIFVEILKECGDEIIEKEKGRVLFHSGKRLSEHMQESMENVYFGFASQQSQAMVLTNSTGSSWTKSILENSPLWSSVLDC